ncbi:hypothetical protein AJ78_05424 [Emergomyces pasteurianus Ep9510]|uniref:Uncharacterized protein n=1 Tax=Emergomyces pasteurianus Ep9510 TaxID=1447872 RepID=A0A1J9PDX0_9EURO|nr:hypothetical protein AJ78_05424 [Emergomyces pasteurianus Ep9510]
MYRNATTASSRRRMNRNSEEAYASPVLQFLSEPPLSLPSPHISQERFRRTRGSSSDEDETEDGIRSEDFRVLHLAQIIRSRDSGQSCILCSSKFSRSIGSNLSVGACLRSSTTNEDEGPIETIVISATRTERDNSWKIACKDVLSILRSFGFDNFSVELIGERANIEKFTAPVMPEDAIYSRWDDISCKICDLLGLEGWLSLECFRRDTKNPQKSHPTVLLTVPRDTTKEWKSKRDEISILLDMEGLEEVAVEIIRSKIWRATEFDLTTVVLPDDAWETKVKLGASIGIRNSDYSGSTFGGFVELLGTEKKGWHVFGLTCYHAVEPGDVPPNSNWKKFPPVGLYKDERFGTTFSGEIIDDTTGVEPAQNEELYKFGRRTNLTKGRYNGLKSLELKCWKPGNKIVTNECSVTSLPGSGAFSKRGNSESFVVDYCDQLC